MNKKYFKHSIPFLALLLSLTIIGAGCFGSDDTGPTGPDMGVWKTSDRGQTWVHKKALVDGPRISAGAAELSVQAITLDPEDRNAVYLGTRANGLVFSLNGGDSWEMMKTLEATDVKTVSVDSKNKCVVYVGSANKIYKTENCGRDWEVAFFDPRTDRLFTQIMVDWFNPTIVYSATNDGDIFKSTDAGESWQVVKRASLGVTSLAISIHDSRVIYAGTDGDGLWKSLDGGVTWIQIKKEFGDIGNARRILKVVLDPTDPNIIYIVHKGGIAKSMDGGVVWESLNLVTDVGEDKITDLVIDPNNHLSMVYTGPTTLVFSQDGGNTWEVKKLPTTNYGSVVAIDPQDGNIVYLGIVPGKKK